MKSNLTLIIILVLAAVLRLVALDKYPAGINADEAAIGYNVWSLLQTGQDEHGATWPLVFRSFDDYKPAGYFYMVLPFVKILGLNIWAVRLPSALLGIASVYLIYLLVKELRGLDLKGIALLAALLLAVSPWHLHFSRGGWEVNAATFFLILGLYFFLKAPKTPKYFVFSALSLLVSLYTYHSMRLIIPFLGVSLVIIYFRQIKKSFATGKKIILLTMLLGAVLATPLLTQMLSSQGQSRFVGVSVFADQGPLWEALELRREYKGPQIVAKVLYNRYIFYGKRFLQNYLSHFSPRFLFITGDEIARSRVPDTGQFYLFLFPFYFLGLFNLFRVDSAGKKAILAWLLLAPIPAALTFQSPHALRAQNMVIPLNIIIALGIVDLFNWLKYPKLKFVTYALLLIILSASFIRYLHRYYVVYPRQLPYAWEYGLDQVADYVKQNEDKYDQIIISDRFDQPYIIMAFYLKYPPEKFQQEIVLEARDKFGFSTVRHFGKYYFRPINWDEDKALSNTLLIAINEPVPQDQVFHTINDPAGQPLFKFISTLVK